MKIAMNFLEFLQKNSNSIGHLIMSLAFMVFLGIVILVTHDAGTVTFAVGLMTLLFGYWFGAQSTAIKHQDAPTVPAEIDQNKVPTEKLPVVKKTVANNGQ